MLLGWLGTAAVGAITSVARPPETCRFLGLLLDGEVGRTTVVGMTVAAETGTCRFPGWLEEGITTVGRTTVVGMAVAELTTCRFPGWFTEGVATVPAAIIVVAPGLVGVG